MPERLLELKEERRRGNLRGLPSICSTHPMVLRASLDHAVSHPGPLLVGASSWQVNPFSALTPAGYRDSLHALASVAGLHPARLILGAEHLGPGPWRQEESGPAMARACETVEAFVAAGFRKLHLDAWMACADDPPVLDETVAAERAAALCLRAERAYASAPDGHPPVYVLGPLAQPPVPARPTTPESLERALDAFQVALAKTGSLAAWDRLVAMEAQTGASFAETSIKPYERKKALPLAKAIHERTPWMFEVRATDYQHPQALRELVEDGCGLLKVGPWLTFACREALFALEDLARELNWMDPGRPVIQLREVLDLAMRRNPAHWKDHHSGTPGEQVFARLFSYSDRSRFYWTDPEVDAEVARLLEATAGPLPSQLLSQHLPLALDAVLDGELAPNGRAIVLHAVRRVLGHYTAACR